MSRKKTFFLLVVYTLGIRFQILNQRGPSTFLKTTFFLSIFPFVYRVPGYGANHSRPRSSVHETRCANPGYDRVRFPLAAVLSVRVISPPAKGPKIETENTCGTRTHYVKGHTRTDVRKTHRKSTSPAGNRRVRDHVGTDGARVLFTRVPVVPCSFREQLGNRYGRRTGVCGSRQQSGA